MDRESPELIEREMEETRESLTEKVSLLEQQVVEKLQSATDAVQDTVQTVRSAVEDTVTVVSGTVKQSVESVSEGMKEALNVKKHVREHPWAMIGGAATAGFITGLLVFRREPSAATAKEPLAAGGSLPAFTPVPALATAPTHQRPGWLSDLFELAGREIKKIAELALATTAASLKQSVEAGIPKLIENALPNKGSRCESTGASAETHYGNGPSYSGMRR
ncbi:MAG TPA: hypothetical protein VKD71_16000 [Gemmataceae bacterium]|nr:hypothetical protein [Gemmataceae bacterium]